MTDHVSGSESRGQEEVKLSPLILRVFAFVLVLGLLLFGLSGRLDWVQGWAWLIANLIVLLIGVIVVPIDPELLHERTTMKQDAKNWDKVIATVLSVFTPMGLIIPAALDMRYGWSSPIPLWVEIAALMIAVLAYGLMFWAGATNRFATRYVRIQRDRNHTVVTDGPYRYVRHPSYIGGILYIFATPVALGSLWTLIISVGLALLTILRTALEDRTLQRELPGYAEYAQRTRSRLLPGVW